MNEVVTNIFMNNYVIFNIKCYHIMKKGYLKVFYSNKFLNFRCNFVKNNLFPPLQVIVKIYFTILKCT